MPPKTPSQFPVLPPYARELIGQPEILLRILNLLASAFSGKSVTNVDVAGSLALQEFGTEFTISGGVIDLTQGAGQNTASPSAVVVDTESDAAADDLDTINGGRDGMVLLLRQANAARVVTVKDGTGNVTLAADADLLNDAYMKLIYNAALAKWIADPTPLTEVYVVFNVTTGHSHDGVDSRIAVNKSAYVAKTATYTITNADCQIECTANTFTVTLPTAVGITGQEFAIKNSGAGLITVACDGSEEIDGSATQVLSQYDNLVVRSNGADWIIV